MIQSFGDSETELIYNGIQSEGFWSIRINDQWRIIFKFDNTGANYVKITDYH